MSHHYMTYITLYLRHTHTHITSTLVSSIELVKVSFVVVVCSKHHHNVDLC